MSKWFAAIASVCALLAEGVSAADYYSTPYNVSGYFVNSQTDYGSIEAAEEAWWAGYHIYWNQQYASGHGPLESNCGYTLTMLTPSGGDERIARLSLTGFCSGGNYITAAHYSSPPPPPPPPEKGQKQKGGQCPDNLCGNPINTATGNKFQVERDLFVNDLLQFERYYNSGSDSATHLLGNQWTNTYSRYITLVAAVATNPTTALVQRPDGSSVAFRKSQANWIADDDQESSLQRLTSGGVLTGWIFTEIDGREVENYDALGRLTSIVRLDGESVMLEYNGGVIENNADDYLLTSVTDQSGRRLVFTYDANRRIDTLTEPTGQSVAYAYDGNGRLIGVTFPGSVSKAYLYNESSHTSTTNLPNALTGIVDEESQRYATFEYAPDGRAISTEHGAGVDKYSMVYNGNGTTSMTRPSGVVQVRGFTTVLDVKKTSSVSETQGSITRIRSYTFDAAGRNDVTIDALGIATDENYDSRGLLTQVVENTANTGSTRRTTQTDWHPNFSLPTESRLYDSGSALPGTLKSRHATAYNSRGQATATCQIDPSNSTAMAYTCGSSTNAPTGVRQTRMTYCEAGDVTAGTCPRIGLMISTDGPRTDVTDATTYTYYSSDDAGCASLPTTCPHRKGDLWKVTNALGQIGEILSYDAAGRVLSSKDANGVEIDTEYNGRGWLTARKVRGTNNSSEADDAITLLDYDATGAVIEISQPDGATMGFAYDIAHRLTDVTDTLGNSLHYALDNAGNRVQEESKNSGGTVKRSLSRVYDTLNELEALADAYATPTDFTYDLAGRLDTTIDMLGRISDNDYDALGRLTQSIANAAGSGAQRPVTGFVYDARDHLTTVTDPKGLATTYAYSGLDDLIQLVSPDTGTTTYSYDSAGNRSGQTDARGIAASYAYDALGRLTAQTFPSTSENMAYYYDTAEADCASGETFTAGRLTKFSDQSGSTRFCYDRRGNLVRKVQTDVGGSGTYTIGATYDAADRITALTYPSGAIVTYQRNANSQIERVDAIPSATSSQVTVVSSIGYLPFGPINTLTFGNGRVLTKSYDQNYGIDSVSDSAATNPLSLDFTLDAQGNITGLSERTDASTVVSRTYNYDALDRLTAQKNGATTIEGFTYDATGNRTNRTQPNLTYNYASTSHRLVDTSNPMDDTRAYDGNGNLIKAGTGNQAPNYAYTDFNRMRQHKTGTQPIGTTNYLYNARGERVSKQNASANGAGTRFVYDEAGHLLGEYNKSGTRQKEYVWVGDTLVGIMQGTGANTAYYYVETDHLGTPRAVVKPGTDTIVWRWNMNTSAFGEHGTQTDPDSDGTPYGLELRFPGQYKDGESGLFYNYFRDYDPSTGRYVQSDPIGLGGGVSTFGYTLGSPLAYSDPLGLEPRLFAVPLRGKPPVRGAGGRRILSQADAELFAQAVQVARKKLRDCKCSCPDAANGYCFREDDKQAVLEMLEETDYYYDGNWSKNAQSISGMVYEPYGATLYRSAFTSGVDWLASVLVHEANHRASHGRYFSGEPGSYHIDKTCFGFDHYRKSR